MRGGCEPVSRTWRPCVRHYAAVSKRSQAERARWRISTDLCRKSTCLRPLGCADHEASSACGSLARALFVAARHSDAPRRKPTQDRRGPYARIAILRPLDGRHGRLRSRVHPAPRVAPAGQGPWAWYGWTSSGPVNGSGGSSTPRSGTRPPAWTTRSRRRKTSGTTFQRHAARRSSWGTRSTSSCRRSRAARASRNRPLGSSSRPWTSTPGAAQAFEAALGAEPATLQGETLWYRMVAGGRLRAMSGCVRGPACRRSSTAERTGASGRGQPVDREDDRRDPDLRPTMSYGLAPGGMMPINERVRTGSRRVSARLPRHVQLDRDRQGRRAGRAARRSATIPTRAGRSATRSRTTSTTRARPTACCTRCAASGPRAAASSRASRGTRRSTTIAARLRDVIATHGAEAIWPFLGTGNMGCSRAPTAPAAGSGTCSARRATCMTICTIAGGFGTGYTLGDNRVGMDPETFRDSKLIVLWGANVLSTHPHLWRSILEARQHGAHVVAIDPIRTRTAAASDWHLAPMPGTDAALALGLLHVVLAEGREDREFIDGAHARLGSVPRSASSSFRPRASPRSPGFRASRSSSWASGWPRLGRPASASASASSATAAAAWRCGRSPASPASPATGAIRAAASATTRAASSA